MLAELAPHLPLELDFRLEAANAARCRAFFAPGGGGSALAGQVVVPAVHAELSSTRVLTMGFEEGVSVTDVAGIAEMRLRPHAVARQLSECFCAMIFGGGSPLTLTLALTLTLNLTPTRTLTLTPTRTLTLTLALALTLTRTLTPTLALALTPIRWRLRALRSSPRQRARAPDARRRCFVVFQGGAARAARPRTLPRAAAPLHPHLQVDP